VATEYVRAVNLTEPVSSIKRWSLDPAIVHLNHGSYGGCPHAVTLTATAWRARLEAAPMKFFVLDWQNELDRARASLAEFVHAPAERLVFVPSATAGVAIALNSVALAAGDEIVTIDQAYRACMNQLKRLAAARGATISVVAVPLPFDAGALIDAVSRALTPRTRLALFDHIISPTALVLPIAELVALCTARGIQVVVDGAHAPGQIPLDVTAIGATWYTGNCHKWLCAPRGSGFLVIADDAAARPVVTSHGASPEYGPPNRLHAELDWSGTHDPAAHLTTPSVLATLAVEGGGWPAIYERNHALACEMRRRFSDGASTPPLAPDDALGCMAAIPIELPPGATPLALVTKLLGDGWEVQIVDFPRYPMVRISAHLYNHAGEAEQLAAKLRSLGVTIR
jgi:isopenicillin-N epimerase